MFAHGECHQDLNYLVRSGNGQNGNSQVCLDKVTGRFLCTELIHQNGLQRESKARLTNAAVHRTNSDGILQLNCSSKRQKSRGLQGFCRKKIPLDTSLSTGAVPSSPGLQIPSNNRSYRQCKGTGSTHKTQTFDWRRFLRKSRAPNEESNRGQPLVSDSLKDRNQNSTWSPDSLPAIKHSSNCVRRPSPSVKSIAHTIMSEEATSASDKKYQLSQDARTINQTQNARTTLTPLAAVSCKETTSKIDSIPLTKKVSRVIQVDGVSYKVTMEPPARTSKRQSPVIKKINLNGTGPLENGTLGGSTCSRSASGQVDRLSNLSVSVGNTPSLRGDPTAWDNERNEKSTSIDLCANDVVDPKLDDALDHAALRLRGLIGQLDSDQACPADVLRHNLEYAISVLESRHIKDVSRAETNSFEDEMSTHLNGETPVPPEIKRWLLQTFSNSKADVRSKRDTEKRSLRSVVHAVQAGMFVERIFRKNVESTNNLPPVVIEKLKLGDEWTFDVFDLEEVSDGNSLKYVYFHLLSKYDLIRKFKIPQKSLWSYCHKLQQGYRRHNNRYHNPIHAADVAQTLNCMLIQSGFVHWLSDQEIFSMITAAVVHDLEHTGTTNNFHTNTRSNLAQLYNDRSVLENHHISSAFRLMQEDDCNIMSGMNTDDYQECRALMIDMVLATDMSQHFGQIQKMKSALSHPETLEKSRAMCLMIHSADINHPSKPWHLHHKWTERLVVEFFEQGDRERELNLPISPLCDRHTTMVAQSQIGFIDYVIEPTFNILFDMYKNVNGQVIHDHILATRSGSASGSRGQPGSTAARSSAADDVLKRRFSDCSSYSSAITNRAEILRSTNEGRKRCFAYMEHNRTQWQRKNEIEREHNLFGNDSFTKAPQFTPDPLPTFNITPSNGTVTTSQQPTVTSQTTKDRTIDSNDVMEPT
uniref:Phosphodiesterase n=1 Tax=Phallusia mammillata TaxID=59560 RepID=A0A6F9DP29_9ASCI|nr:calcium/calmodulin-dependent 3',5'-cyclic nucleotide phosphodiesterase 1A-like [Phallusia mammillata]